MKSDIHYGDKSRNKLDHYMADGDPKRPTILFFYGGNWRSGRKEDYRFVADTLASHGYNVVIPDYRLYPLVRFLQIQDDAVKALQWVVDNIDSAQPIYIIGHSAGAQLGALLCLNKSLLKGQVDTHQRIRGFIGLAGPYDFYPFTEEHHWDLFSPKERYPESQAINYVRPDCPPMYLLHGETDNVVRRGNSKSLMEKVQAAGGWAQREVYENKGHIDILLSFTQVHRRNNPVIRDIIEFLGSMQATKQIPAKGSITPLPGENYGT